MQTLPLIQASIKSFVRNWKSVLLLIIFPLALVSSIFLSFNPDGLQVIPIGIINSENLEINEFKEVISSFLDITDYKELDACLNELKAYNEYVCVDVKMQNSILLNVHFDNTREPVIWEIIQRFKAAIDYIQKEKTKEMASQVLNDFKESTDVIENIRIKFNKVNNEISGQITTLEGSLEILDSKKDILESGINNVEIKLQNIEDYNSDIKTSNSDFYVTSMNRVNYMKESTKLINPIEEEEYLTKNVIASANQMENDIIYLNSYVKDITSNTDSTINNLNNNMNTIKSDILDLSDEVIDLESTKNNLEIAKENLDEIEQLIPKPDDYGNAIDEIDPELLVNPIVVRNLQTYIPKVVHENKLSLGETTDNATKDLVKKVNLIGLQTIFPNILILITLFLSLLISAFVALTEINSPATIRIRTIKGLFFSEAISIFISSFIIITIPLSCVLFLGEYLFQLPIIANIQFSLPIMLLLASVFILLGMSLSFLIKKESITMLITTFILVFLVFVSGFILPVERMSNIPNLIAINSPGNLALGAFNKVVFYEQGFPAIADNFKGLGIWLISLIGISLLIKKIRR